MANVKSADVWGAIRSIGVQERFLESIAPSIVAKLIELKFATKTANGLPKLTALGERAFLVYVTGRGEIAALAGTWC